MPPDGNGTSVCALCPSLGTHTFLDRRRRAPESVRVCQRHQQALLAGDVELPPIPQSAPHPALKTSRCGQCPVPVTRPCRRICPEPASEEPPALPPTPAPRPRPTPTSPEATMPAKKPLRIPLLRAIRSSAHRGTTTGDMTTRFDASASTIRKYLHALEDEGKVVRTGKGAATRWYATGQAPEPTPAPEAPSVPAPTPAPTPALTSTAEGASQPAPTASPPERSPGRPPSGASLGGPGEHPSLLMLDAVAALERALAAADAAGSFALDDEAELESARRVLLRAAIDLRGAA